MYPPPLHSRQSHITALQPTLRQQHYAAQLQTPHLQQFPHHRPALVHNVTPSLQDVPLSPSHTSEHVPFSPSHSTGHVPLGPSHATGYIPLSPSYSTAHVAQIEGHQNKHQTPESLINRGQAVDELKGGSGQNIVLSNTQLFHNQKLPQQYGMHSQGFHPVNMDEVTVQNIGAAQVLSSVQLASSLPPKDKPHTIVTSEKPEQMESAGCQDLPFSRFTDSELELCLPRIKDGLHSNQDRPVQTYNRESSPARSVNYQDKLSSQTQSDSLLDLVSSCSSTVSTGHEALWPKMLTSSSPKQSPAAKGTSFLKNSLQSFTQSAQNVASFSQRSSDSEDENYFRSPQMRSPRQQKAAGGMLSAPGGAELSLDDVEVKQQTTPVKQMQSWADIEVSAQCVMRSL